MFLKYRSDYFLLAGNSPRFLPWGPKSWSWYASSSTLLLLIQSHFWSSQELLTAACTHPSTPPFTLSAPLSWFCSLSLERPQAPILINFFCFKCYLPSPLCLYTLKTKYPHCSLALPYIWQIPFHCIIFISFHLLDNSLQKTGRVGFYFVPVSSLLLGLRCVFNTHLWPERREKEREGRLGKWHEGRERRRREEGFSLH